MRDIVTERTAEVLRAHEPFPLWWTEVLECTCDDWDGEGAFADHLIAVLGQPTGESAA